MALNTQTLQINVRGDSKSAVAAFGQVERAQERLIQTTRTLANKQKTQFAQVAGAFTTLFVAREVGRGLIGAIAPAIQLEEALGRLEARAGVTGHALEEMRVRAMEVASATAFDTTEAVEGLRELTVQGLSAREAMAALGPVARLAQVAEKEGLSFQESARVAGTLYRELGLSATELQHVYDGLAATQQRLGFSFENFNDVAGKLGGVARDTGMDLQEVLILWGLTNQTMRSNERSSTGVLGLMRELSDAEKRMAFRDCVQRTYYRPTNWSIS